MRKCGGKREGGRERRRQGRREQVIAQETYSINHITQKSNLFICCKVFPR